jgi:hypothetical protein
VLVGSTFTKVGKTREIAKVRINKGIYYFVSCFFLFMLFNFNPFTMSGMFNKPKKTTQQPFRGQLYSSEQSSKSNCNILIIPIGMPSWFLSGILKLPHARSLPAAREIFAQYARL